MNTAKPIDATLLRQGPLTRRESQVLLGLCRGQTVKGIAQDVGCAPKTVSVHLDRIALKLGARGMLQTALVAVSDGLVKIARNGTHAVFVGLVAWQMAGLDEGLRVRTHRMRVQTMIRVQMATRSAAG